MTDAEKIAELQRRLEILERYVAISMRSSRMTWAPGGLRLEDGYKVNEEVTRQIFGFDPWNPKALDKGG